jgi:hypothetical protein
MVNDTALTHNFFLSDSIMFRHQRRHQMPHFPAIKPFVACIEHTTAFRQVQCLNPYIVKSVEVEQRQQSRFSLAFNGEIVVRFLQQFLLIDCKSESLRVFEI